MDEKQFIENVIEAIDVAEPSNVSIDMDFHDLDEWSSMSGMRMIAMIDESYGVLLSPNEINRCSSFRQLLEIISTKYNG